MQKVGMESQPKASGGVVQMVDQVNFLALKVDRCCIGFQTENMVKNSYGCCIM